MLHKTGFDENAAKLNKSSGSCFSFHEHHIVSFDDETVEKLLGFKTLSLKRF